VNKAPQEILGPESAFLKFKYMAFLWRKTAWSNYRPVGHMWPGLQSPTC